MENFYYSAIYDVIQDPSSNNEKAINLKRLKARIICLNSTHQHAVLVDICDRDRLRGEGMFLDHPLEGRQRQKQRMVQFVCDQNGNNKSTTADILRVFTDYFKHKYDRRPACVESMTSLLLDEIKILPESANTALEKPITLDELDKAIRQAKPSKAPGRDGICKEFYKAMWGTVKRDLLDILNEMYKEGHITDQQKYDIIICIPKQTSLTQTEDYRPLTLLNTDYKLLTRIIVNRLRPWLTYYTHPSSVVYGVSRSLRP
jgi:hypothetical protein